MLIFTFTHLHKPSLSSQPYHPHFPSLTHTNTHFYFSQNFPSFTNPFIHTTPRYSHSRSLTIHTHPLSTFTALTNTFTLTISLLPLILHYSDIFLTLTHSPLLTLWFFTLTYVSSRIYMLSHHYYSQMPRLFLHLTT